MAEDQPDDEFVEREDREVGVGPYPLPWPEDTRFDPEMLEHGDRRNVADAYPTGLTKQSSPTSTRVDIHFMLPSKIGNMISTSEPWCAQRTRSTPRVFTSLARSGGTVEAQW
jgi:hypothetical protein